MMPKHRLSITIAALVLASLFGGQGTAQPLPDHSVRFEADTASCRVTFHPDARTGEAEPELEISVNMLSGQFDMGLKGGPYAKQEFLWGSTRTDLRPIRNISPQDLAAEPAWDVLVLAAAEQAPIYFTVQDDLERYASVRYDGLTPALISRTVSLACDVIGPDVSAPTEIEARRAERRLDLAGADILHIRRVLNSRYGEPGVQPGSTSTLTVTDRRHIAQYNTENDAEGLEYLTAETAAALLAEELELPKDEQIADPTVEGEAFRDWTLVADAAGETCKISTPAASGTGFTGTVRPRMQFSVDRSGSGGLMAIDLTQPNPFAVDSPIRAIVGDQAIDLFVEPSTRALAPRPLADGKLSNAFTALLRQSDGAVLEGFSADTGAPLILAYSGFGFTAAFRAMAERCNRPGVLGWIE